MFKNQCFTGKAAKGKDHPKRGSCCYAMNINRDKFRGRSRETTSRAFFLKNNFCQSNSEQPRDLRKGGVTPVISF